MLLNKVRKIVKLVNKSNVLITFVKAKSKELDIKTSNFIIDFHVRWNTTYLMLDRFLILKPIVVVLTSNPKSIFNIRKDIIKKLEGSSISSQDWDF